MKTINFLLTALIATTMLFSACSKDNDPAVYTVTVTNGGNGIAAADKTSPQKGETVTLVAAPDNGYMFDKWTVVSGGITLSPDATTNPVTFIMPAEAVSIKAEFTMEPVVTIISFSPTSAKHGESVTINGTNFSTMASENIVMFNGVPATVTAADVTQLTVIVPKNKTASGELKVTAGGKSATAVEPFTYELTYIVSTFAGNGTAGYVNGTGTNAQFDHPQDIAIDAAGNLYVTDHDNHRIRKITSAGVVSTFAGNGTNGFANGAGANAQFSNPVGVTIDATGNLYVTDRNNRRIRKITSAGVVSTFAGSGTKGNADGTSAEAQFDSPFGVVLDAENNVYVTDFVSHRIRKITFDGVVSTFAGITEGYADGTGTNAQFHNPTGVAIDAEGNLYVTDSENDRIRKITPRREVSTLAGSTTGYVDNTGTAAKFDYPIGIAIDATGNLYVSERGNNRIRKITSEGVVSTFAGSSTSGNADGTSTEAQFRWPYGVAIDAEGNLYVAEYFNHCIRKITAE